MTAFQRFDPETFLRERRASPPKPAKVPKAGADEPATAAALGSLGTLGGPARSTSFRRFDPVAFLREHASTAPAAPSPTSLDGSGEEWSSTRDLDGGTKDGRTEADWQPVFQAYRAKALARGMVPAMAVHNAYGACVIDWLNQNLEPSPPHACAHCGAAASSTSIVLPFGTERHTWLHNECWAAWRERRHRLAERELASAGIAKPSST